MKRTPTIALAALVALAISPAYAIAADSSALTDAVRVAALAPRIPIGATRLGELTSTQKLTIDVVLRPSRPAELAARLEALYDPTSPQYEQWLTPDEFAREFGPSDAQVAGITAWLHAKGLSDTSVQGFAVHATGAAHAVENALGVSFSRYRLARGATGYVASSAPLIPRGLADGIATIAGLSDTVRFDNYLDVTPHRLTTNAAPRGANAATPSATPHAAPTACTSARNFAGFSFWTPDQVAAIYGVNDLVNAGLDGRGKKIALVELAPSRPADTDAYLACYGLDNEVTVVEVDGGADPDLYGTVEAEIDIQEAATTAPGAAIVSYEGPNSAQGMYDLYNKIVLDNVPVVSTSWGLCEAVLQSDAPGFMDSLHVLFQQAAAQGQSVVAAAGDSGSEDCYDGTITPPSETLQVDSPADDPLVTGVGGTSLETEVEPVWNECEGTLDNSCAAGGGYAAGGGQSTQFARPDWQPLAPDATCSTCRGVPDVSANAGVGEVFYDSDFGGGPDHWIAVGGTSIAAPKLAGIIADIATACTGGRIGDFAPKLDALAAMNVYGTALRDVTTGLDPSGPNLVSPGDNDLTRTNGGQYETAVGFDLASGIGTPIASGLSCPQVMSLAPTHGKAGTLVTLHGLGLEQATIKFGSTTATVLSASAKSATVVVPAGTGTVKVSGSDPIGSGTHRATFKYPGVKPPVVKPPVVKPSIVGSAAYRTVAADGGIFNFGSPFYGSPVGSFTAPIVGTAVDQVTGGYWVASADGNVYNFNAPFLGSLAGTPLNQPIVGVAATKNGDGYLLVARDGGVFAFGNARFYGSMGAVRLNAPIVGIAATKNGDGYWLVASDGGVFAFGNAPFRGSLGAVRLNAPIVGIAATKNGDGYWLVASDGGVFAFGNARFYGSLGGTRLNQPIVGIAATKKGDGYWLVASDGGVFAFGNARFAGSTGAIILNQPMVAIAPAR